MLYLGRGEVLEARRVLRPGEQCACRDPAFGDSRRERGAGVGARQSKRGGGDGVADLSLAFFVQIKYIRVAENVRHHSALRDHEKGTGSLTLRFPDSSSTK